MKKRAVLGLGVLVDLQQDSQIGVGRELMKRQWLVGFVLGVQRSLVLWKNWMRWLWKTKKLLLIKMKTESFWEWRSFWVSWWVVRLQQLKGQHA